ncbi:hypothetical protein R6Q57_024168, partial [Mikania cordata]
IRKYMFVASRENNKTRRNVGIERISPRTGKKFYIPVVPILEKPEAGMMFRTIDEAYNFYERYAKNGGFTIRKNTEVTKHGIVTLNVISVNFR